MINNEPVRRLRERECEGEVGNDWLSFMIRERGELRNVKRSHAFVTVCFPREIFFVPLMLSIIYKIIDDTAETKNSEL